MRPSGTVPAGLLVLLLALGGPGAAMAQSDSGSGSESMTESWYLLRGRANMKIGNYQAAIEAFEKATELNPDNRESMRSLGIAYEKQGLTTRAIEQFDRYLERFPDDPEIAFRQADYLSWERYAYRRNDAIRYYRMGLVHQEDRGRRHRMARLLAQDRSRLEEALEQYRILLAAEPDNGPWRAEYRELLLWDPDHLAEAVEEYRRLAAERPGDFEVRRSLARLVERQKPRDDEAVRMYRDLVAERPKDAALRLELAKALAHRPQHREDALEEYRRVLAVAPAAETREEYADLLSGNPFDRSAALEQYATLVRELPDDVGVRLKYARLLSSEREDTERAIEQYDRVLARDPHNPEAHAGLASSYAWLGDRDRALRHANLALRHGGGGGRAAELRRDLLVGREPRVEPYLQALIQRGPSKSELDGVRLGFRGQLDPSPFATLRIDAGFEDYWRSGDDTAGGYVGGAAEFRLDPRQRVDLGLAYHSLGASSGRNVIGKLAYSRQGQVLDWSAAFERSLREDSYVALVGVREDGVHIGAARENRFSALLEGERGRLDFALEPYVGWVDADGASDNPFVGLRGRSAYAFVDRDRFTFGSALGLELYHYRDDAFGVDPMQSSPEPGGYFSPSLFFEAVPGVAAKIRFGDDGFFDLAGGPALQVVDESGGGSQFKVGGQARLSYLLFLRKSLFWSVGGAFVRIEDAYTRIDLQTSLTFKF